MGFNPRRVVIPSSLLVGASPAQQAVFIYKPPSSSQAV